MAFGYPYGKRKKKTEKLAIYRLIEPRLYCEIRKWVMFMLLSYQAYTGYFLRCYIFDGEFGNGGEGERMRTKYIHRGTYIRFVHAQSHISTSTDISPPLCSNFTTYCVDAKAPDLLVEVCKILNRPMAGKRNKYLLDRGRDRANKPNYYYDS